MKFDRYLKGYCLLLTLFWRRICVRCTIDVNLPELQYLADHLDPQECRKLVAALHFKSYDLPTNVEEAELRLSKEMPCIRLLLHWNTTPGEGRGETHEILGRRLRQIDRADLADWLGRTVFHELGLDIERSMDSPFKEFLTTESIKVGYGPQLIADENATIPNFDWLPIDTISYTIVLVLIAVVIGVVCKSIIRKLRGRKHKKKRKYKKLRSNDKECSCTSDCSCSDSDSEHHI